MFHSYKYQYYTITNPWVCSDPLSMSVWVSEGPTQFIKANTEGSTLGMGISILIPSGVLMTCFQIHLHEKFAIGKWHVHCSFMVCKLAANCMQLFPLGIETIGKKNIRLQRKMFSYYSFLGNHKGLLYTVICSLFLLSNKRNTFSESILSKHLKARGELKRL